MSFRKAIKILKYLVVIVGLIAGYTKGSQYLSSAKTGDNTVAVSYPNVSSKDFSLKEFLPADNNNRQHQLLVRKSYVVSYNSETKCPNWVFWELTAEHADGNVKRPDYAFHEDMEVPAPRAELEDYRRSSYDRGHMCPAGDNKWDEDAMYESFLMTNMCPQNQNLNSGLWNQIEMQCRHWAKKHGRIYIVCGPIFMNREHETIGRNKVVVPEAFFKVVVCLDGTPKGIGFICRNTDGNKKKDYYVNTISQVECITGYNFFPNLEQETTEVVKGYADLKDWEKIIAN